MDRNSIIGRMLSGYACIAYAATLAAWMAHDALAPMAHTAQAVSNALP